MEEMTEISIDASSREMQGRQLTEQQIEMLSTEQKASIDKLRGRALEHGEKEPIFHVSVDFDVTRAEDVITNEQERLARRKELQQRKAAGECITEAEVNADNRVDMTDGEKDRRFFPPTAMVWTTIQRAKMEDI